MIKFRDLLFAKMDTGPEDMISVIIESGLPDQMLMKSARAIYGDYFVIWFSGNMFSICQEEFS